ncbi:hypothetical protein GCM10009716_14600 [Streptomyces sodiiphilus]|uniref:DUF4259 domain-containing protein n=2 Tax=Streptomyces sodiiphilus TaxID=226217 RepID=A0ABN2NX50_9ACTN
MLLDVTDAAGITGAARERIEADDLMPAEQRRRAADAVRDDAAEALAFLVDPATLVSRIPGVELAQATWSSEHALGLDDVESDLLDGLDELDGLWDEDPARDEDNGGPHGRR